MSGGSMDYLCYKIEDQIPMIRDREIRMLAKDFADLMHDCEWYIDDDICNETWQKSLAKFKSKWFGKRDERLREIIDSAVGELRSELLDMIGDGMFTDKANRTPQKQTKGEK